MLMLVSSACHTRYIYVPSARSSSQRSVPVYAPMYPSQSGGYISGPNAEQLDFIGGE